ncbi:MAG: MotA/TolQ/ExbB proton channel family protein [Gemmatimonadetes bacterium]|nr:MotA/TolQ/ExbB proton channel family protein [Gemmatimonadota bacterium]
MEPSNTFTLLSVFHDGGEFMYPLLICSLFALGVMIAKAWTLLAAHRNSRSILAQTQDLIKAGKIQDAVTLCEQTPGPVAAILLSGLRRVQANDLRSEDVEKAVKTTGSIELGFLERGLPILATVSNVAPLLGFLGTVAGMISAFGAIELAGQVEASLVASGIKIALITTATGLLIAIPVNIGYNFFVTRIDKLIVEMEEGAAKILALIWDLTDRQAAARA